MQTQYLKHSLFFLLILFYIPISYAYETTLLNGCNATLAETNENVEAVMATFETVADGPWQSASTWLGGSIPSNVIQGGDIVTIKHNVTYNVGDDLFIDKDGSVGTLEIIGGSLTFPNSSGDGFGKSVKIGSLGNFTMCNASLTLPIFDSGGGNNSGNFENAGTVEIYNSTVDVAQNWSSTAGTRTFNGGCLRVGENFENNGSTDAYTDVCIEVGLHDTGNFTNISQITFANTSVLIDLDAGHFENNGGGSILGGANALAQLRVADQIKNDDTWSAEVLTYCFVNGISADNGGQLAANLTGPNDCPGLANASCNSCPINTCTLTANCVVDQNVSCGAGGSPNADGEVSAMVSGASAPCGGGGTGLTYNWEDSGGNQVSTNGTATGLGPGTYFLTVTDAAGCTATCSVTLTDPGCTSCNLDVTCPVSNDLGTFGCNDNLPVIPTLLSEITSPPYNIVIGTLDPSCGDVLFTVMETPAPDQCSSNNPTTITRTITVFLDEDNSGTLNGTEQSQNCDYTYVVSAPDMIIINCPNSVNLAACSSENAIQSAYNSWVNSFSFSGGCNASETSTPPPLPTYVCGGSVSLTYNYVIMDGCGQQAQCTSNFTVATSTPVTVSCPSNMGISACSSQNSVDITFANWINSFSASGGCGNLTVTDLNNLTAPNVCTGGMVNVTYTATDDCGQQASCNASFTVAAPPSLSASCPNPVNLAACSSENAIQTAYNNWVSSFSFSGGCNASETSTPPPLPTYVCGASVSLTYNYVVAGDCGNQTCSSTFMVAGATPLSVSCPNSVNLAACSSENAIQTAYNNWVNSFSFSGGCNASETSTPPPLPAYVCGASVGLVYNYVVTDDCGSQTCSSTFMIAGAGPLNVSCPNSVNLAACSSENAIQTAYNNWVNSFSFSGGCNASETSTPPPLPPYVFGAPVSLTYNYVVTDDCGSQTCSSTFMVAGAGPLSVSCPNPVNLAACSSENAIQTAYNNWINGFSFSGGCNASETSTPPPLPTYVCGASVSLTYNYVVTDNNGSQTCSSTFMVAGAAPLSVSCPNPVNLSSCSTENTIQTAYNNWVSSFSFSGGCNASETSTPPPLPPYVCGASVNLTYNYVVTDDCGSQTCSSTFMAAGATSLSVNCPNPVNFAACSSENAIQTAYTNWVSSFSFSGGCNASETSTPPPLPTYVCGGAVSLTYNYVVMDDCGSQSCSSTFMVAGATPLSVSCPNPVNLAACSSENTIQTAYNSWVNSFSFSGGCNASETSTPPPLPTYVCGGAVSLTYNYVVMDDCGSQSCSSTFMVAGATPLSVSCPNPVNLAACSSENAIQTAYNNWINSFSFSGGCNASETSSPPPLPTYVSGASVNLTYNYVVMDDCGSQTCSSTFMVGGSSPLSVSCPNPVNLPACSSENAIQTAYNNWINSFSFSGGCNASETSTPPSLPPYVCGASVNLTYNYVVTDDNGSQTCSSTFMVSGSSPLSVSCPNPVNLAACSSENAIQTAYNNWVSSFSFSGGCNASETSTPPPLPTYVCGASVSLTYNYVVMDDCGSQTCSSTFMVAGATPLSVSCPNPVNLAACSSENAIQTAYNNWVNSFNFSGGCNASETSTPPLLPTYVCGASVSLTYNYVVMDDCGSQTCSSTFMVAGSGPLSVSCPNPVNLAACSSENTIQTAYNNWVSSFSFSGGCNASETSSPPPLPTYVPGGSVNLTYNYVVMDDCGSQTCSSTFMVGGSSPLSVSCPNPVNLPACSSESSIQVAYNNWINSFSFSGGCNASETSTPPSLPPYVCGESVSLTYNYVVTDDNGSQTCSSTFMVGGSSPLSVSCPNPVNLAACSSENAIQAAYNNWVNSFSFSGGCNASETSTPPLLPTYVCGASVSLTYNYVVMDDCGSQTCSSTFMVAGSSPLSVNCPNPVNLSSSSSENAIQVAYNNWVNSFSFSGGCNASEISSPPPLPTYVCGVSVNLTYNYVVMDDCGSQSCSSTFMVDGSSPLNVSCPNPVNLPACSSENAIQTAYNNWINSFSFSGGCNASETSTPPSLPPYVCGASVSLTYNYVVTDGNNSQTCSSTFMVGGSSLLSISCPNPVNLPSCSSESTIQSAYNNWINSFSFSGGCNASETSNPPPLPSYVCGGAVSLTYNYVVMDDCGSQSCSSTFTVGGSSPLSVSCPNPVNLASCSSEGSIQLAYNNWVNSFSFSGGCNASETSNPPPLPPYICGGAVSLTYNYVVMDDCGSQTCSSTFMVAGAAPLSVSCPGSQIEVACQSQNMINTAFANWIASFSYTGGCNAQATDLSNFSAPNVCDGGTVTVAYVATDDCGQQQQCTASFIVTDNQAPTIILNNPLADIGCNDPFPSSNAVTVSDDCGNAMLQFEVLPYNEDVCNGYTVTYQWTATDDCGQSTILTESFDVLPDVSPPAITPVHPDLIDLEDGEELWIACANNDPTWDPFDFGLEPVIATDECSDVSIDLSREIKEVGVCGLDPFKTKWALKWTAADDCGNMASYTIVIVIYDPLPPVFDNIPPNLIVECGQIPPPADVSATDNCSSVSITFEENVVSTGACNSASTIYRTWTAVDACGNTASTTQQINVYDSTPPSINFLDQEWAYVMDGDVLNITCSELDDYHQSDISVGAIDDCGEVTIYQDVQIIESTNCNEDGYAMQITYIWIAVDDCGNESTLRVHLQVQDTQPPVLLGVPEDMCVSTLPPVATVEATDDCTLAGVDFEESVSTCGQGQVVTRTWTAEDLCGNTTTASQTIYVGTSTSLSIGMNVNSGLPAISDGDQITLGASTGVSLDDFVAISDCGLSAFLELDASVLQQGDCETEGFLEVVAYTLTARDACGNVVSLSFTVTYIDDIPPVFGTIEDAIFLHCGENLPSVGATDNLGSVIISVDTLSMGDVCTGEPPMVIEWAATDACGNTSTYIQEVKIIDEQGPVLIGVPEDDCQSTPGPAPVVTAYDECTQQMVPVQFTETTVNGACGTEIIRVWMATDACGNTTTADQHIFNSDDEPPVLYLIGPGIEGLPDGSTYEMSCINAGGILLLPTFDESYVEAFDYCMGDLDIWYESTPIPSEGCQADGFVGAYLYTWYAEDPCGNIGSISIRLVIKDEEAPMIFDVPEDMEVYCEEQIPEMETPLVMDNCSSVEIYPSEEIVNSAHGRVLIRTWTVIDACGNTSVANQHILLSYQNMSCEIGPLSDIECGSEGNTLYGSVTGGTAPYTYVWEMVDCDGFITDGQGTPLITYTAGYTPYQNFLLTVTDANGCQTSCYARVECRDWNTSLAIDETEQPQMSKLSARTDTDMIGLNVKLYPNPAFDIVYIEVEDKGNNSSLHFSLINTTGQIVKSWSQQTRTKGNISLSLESIDAGMYWFIIDTEDGNREMKRLAIIR